MYMRRWLILLLMAFSPLLLQGQGRTDTLRFRAMAYNVENLFDCRHDSLKADEEFLPEALRHWTEHRYWEKLNGLARVIYAVGEWEVPALVGLCEVENPRVMDDLTRRSSLRGVRYRYVMTESDDVRGIDVALLYQPDRFRLLAWQTLRVPKPKQRARPTRDVLHVSGLLLNGDTLDVLLMHFPSRGEGRKETEPYRMQAARTVRRCADSLCRVRHRPCLLLMGDLNDTPSNRSVTEGLQAFPPRKGEPVVRERLYHLLADKTKKSTYGSYKHKGVWSLLDHLMVSGALLDTTSTLYTLPAMADVVRLPFLLTEDIPYGGETPFRTYYGMKYWGGYSDHLPVKVDFILIY